jgi:two-component system response regulator
MDSRPILLVEDNPDDVALTLRAFQKQRIANEVVVAKDGVEALQYLFATGPHASRDPRELPAVVFLDLKLPKVDGLDVMRELRANATTRLVRVVVLTSSKEEHDVLKSYDLGANSYVRKPVSFEAFVEAVGQLGLYWLVLNEAPPVPSPGAS